MPVPASILGDPIAVYGLLNDMRRRGLRDVLRELPPTEMLHYLLLYFCCRFAQQILDCPQNAQPESGIARVEKFNETKYDSLFDVYLNVTGEYE
jgi:hypothetical protein